MVAAFACDIQFEFFLYEKDKQLVHDPLSGAGYQRLGHPVEI